MLRLTAAPRGSRFGDPSSAGLSKGEARSAMKASCSNLTLLRRSAMILVVFLTHHHSATMTFEGDLTALTFDAPRQSDNRTRKRIISNVSGQTLDQQNPTGTSKLPGSLFDPIEVKPQCDRSRRRRVIDVTFINSELATLELRLNELWNAVDIFYIAESTVPFKHGAPNKPTHLTDHWKDFEKFHSKIVVNVLPADAYNALRNGSGNFKIEEKQRRAMWSDVKKLVGPSREDLVIRADLDEIPKQDTIEKLACTASDRLQTPVCLHTKNAFYYYNYRCRIKKEWTIRPVVQFYHQGDNHSCRSTIVNGSTHCSSCFESLDGYHIKARSNSDPIEQPQMQFANSSIIDRVRNCKDFYLRTRLDKRMEMLSTAEVGNYPLIVAKHPERWPYLLGKGPLYED